MGMAGSAGVAVDPGPVAVEGRHEEVKVILVVKHRAMVRKVRGRIPDVGVGDVHIEVKKDPERDFGLRGVLDPEMAIEDVVVGVDPVRQKKRERGEGVQHNPGADNGRPGFIFPGENMFGCDPLEAGDRGEADSADASSDMALLSDMGVGQLPDGSRGVEGDKEASVCKGMFPGQGVS